MRQHVSACGMRVVHNGLYSLRPLYKPEVPTIALRDGPMWSSAPTGFVRIVVAHDHMRQHVSACGMRVVHNGLYSLRPLYKPEVPTIALRDGPMCDAQRVLWEACAAARWGHLIVGAMTMGSANIQIYTTPMQIRDTQPGADLHRRFAFASAAPNRLPAACCNVARWGREAKREKKSWGA